MSNINRLVYEALNNPSIDHIPIFGMNQRKAEEKVKKYYSDSNIEKIKRKIALDEKIDFKDLELENIHIGDIRDQLAFGSKSDPNWGLIIYIVNGKIDTIDFPPKE